uniref:Putative secreted protein n=1 Tax=Anopheles darlingi TaxID=43151 RepID=A0A2M4D9R6_ANODA
MFGIFTVFAWAQLRSCCCWCTHRSYPCNKSLLTLSSSPSPIPRAGNRWKESKNVFCTLTSQAAETMAMVDERPLVCV